MNSSKGLHYEEHRLITFNNKNNFESSKEALAFCGLYYLSSSLVKCYFCKKAFKLFYEEYDHFDIFKLHKKQSEECKLVNGFPTENIPINKLLFDLFVTPRLETDLDSFRTKKYLGINCCEGEKLVIKDILNSQSNCDIKQALFAHSNIKGDYALEIIKLCHERKEEEKRKEEEEKKKREYERTHLMKTFDIDGEEEFEFCVRESTGYSKYFCNFCICVCGNRTGKITDEQPVKNCSECGKFKYSNGREFITTFFCDECNHFQNGDIECQDCERCKPDTLEASSTSKTCEEQNRNENLCMICLNKPLKIAFIPCGHICCCVDCSTKITKCCVCRTDIENNLVIYIP